MPKQFRKTGLANGGATFAWLADGASPEVRRALDEQVPKPVRAVLAGVFGRGYRRDVATAWAR